MGPRKLWNRKTTIGVRFILYVVLLFHSFMGPIETICNLIDGNQNSLFDNFQLICFQVLDTKYRHGGMTGWCRTIQNTSCTGTNQSIKENQSINQSITQLFNHFINNSIKSKELKSSPIPNCTNQILSDSQLYQSNPHRFPTVPFKLFLFLSNDEKDIVIFNHEY